MTVVTINLCKIHLMNLGGGGHDIFMNIGGNKSVVDKINYDIKIDQEICLPGQQFEMIELERVQCLYLLM